MSKNTGVEHFEKIFCSVLFCYSHDGYDLIGVVNKLQLKSRDIKLVTVAQGFHWFDFDNFLNQFVKYFPSNTIFAPIGYSRPHVMNREFLLDENFKIICNKEMVLEEYDEKFEQFEKYMNEFYDFILPYFDFDRRVLENYYVDLPFEDYFANREFQKFSEVQQSDWFKFQQYIFSISAYRVCVEKNETEIAEGTFNDPLVKLLRFVLETEGRLNETNSADFTSPEDADILKSIKFDIIWNFFVYILSN